MTSHAPAPPEAAAPLRRHGAAGRGVDARHVGVPGHRDHVLRRPVHGLPGLPVAVARRLSRRPAITSTFCWGAFNTVVLIVSSLTMALAVRAAQTSAAAEDAGRCGWSPRWSSALAFLGVKAIEYTDKFDAPPRARPALRQWPGQAPGRRRSMFYSLYFCMTGLHALHMVIGLGIMTVIAIMALAAPVRRRLLHAGRGVGPVLALRRHRLDFPVPAALPDRRPRRRVRLRKICQLVTSHRRACITGSSRP